MAGIKIVLRDIVRLAGVQGIANKNKKKGAKKSMKKVISGLGVMGLMFLLKTSGYCATAYFTLPADFSDNVQATIVGIAGGILVILGLMFAWRKTVKSVNRS